MRTASSTLCIVCRFLMLLTSDMSVGVVFITIALHVIKILSVISLQMLDTFASRTRFFAPQIPPCSAACYAIFTTWITLDSPTANSVPTPELMTVQRNLIKDENCDCLNEGRVFISAKVALFLNSVYLIVMFSSPSINASLCSSKQSECVRGGGAVCVSNGVGGLCEGMLT